jgi:Tfp pilus assembly protein PilF
MKNVFILAFTLFLISPNTSYAQGIATVKEYKKMMKTYPFSDPDPVPHPQSRFYPYNRFDGFTDMPVDKEWTVVELENDFLKVQIMPEIGGKIWTAIEKSTGKPFIYNNEVVKFRDVAMRGPWTSGGIEANYGIIGHTPNCAAPVDYLTQKNDDGSVSCFIGWLDLLTRTWWRIEIKLEKDKAYFTTNSLWYNATPLEQPYYHWMNVGIKAAGNLEFIYDGTNYLGHGGEVSDWKINPKNNKNIAFYEKNDFGGYKSYHVFGKYTDFFGGYWHDEDFGMGRYAPHSDKAGKKIWIWGLSQQGMIWEKLLTDKNGQYVEVQSGRLFNQGAEGSNQTPFKQKGFAPYSTDSWTEYWFPVLGTKGFVKANDKAVLNIREGKIWLMALQSIDNELVIKKEGKVFFTKKITLKPMQVFQQDLTDVKKEENIQVILGDKILEYTTDPKHGILNRPVETPKDFDPKSAYALWHDGKALLQMREYDKATEQLQAALAKEPYFMPALCDLAQLNYQRMNYAEALDLLRKALSINTYDGQSNYLYGLVNVKLNNITDAKDGFDLAAMSIEYRSAAYTELSKIYYRKSDFDNALMFAEKSLENNTQNITGLHLMALCEYEKGHESKAEAALEKIIKLNPLNEFWLKNLTLEALRSPRSHLSKADNSIRNEMPNETITEYDFFYSDLNTNINWNGSKPYHDLLFKNEVEKAVQLSSEKYFPFRPESAAILEKAITKTSSWKPKYYLALIKWHFRDFDAAKKLFAECGNTPDYAPFYAARAELLKSALTKEEKLPIQSRLSRDFVDTQYSTDLERAASLDAKQWRYGKSLVQYFIETKNNAKALEIADKYRKMSPQNYYLGLIYAKTLLLNEKYQEGISYMRALKVLPNEGATDGRVLWKELNLMQSVLNFKAKKYTDALKNIADARLWLENLGVGKPYQVDIDERLEDYLEAVCQENLGKKEVANGFFEKVKTWKKEDAKPNFNDILSDFFMDKTGLKKAVEETTFKENENLRVLKKLL